MKYLLDAIFLAISACLCWVVWDATAGNILSQRHLVAFLFLRIFISTLSSTTNPREKPVLY